MAEQGLVIGLLRRVCKQISSSCTGSDEVRSLGPLALMSRRILVQPAMRTQYFRSSLLLEGFGLHSIRNSATT